MYVLVLGLDVLGNPFALITGLKEGAIDFFYEPYQVRCAPFPEFAQQKEVWKNPGNEVGVEEVQTFRFWDERVRIPNTEYCSRVNQRHFGGKNEIADVILRRVLARMSWWQEQEVIKCEKYYHFVTGEDLTSFSINNHTNFFREKK